MNTVYIESKIIAATIVPLEKKSRDAEDDKDDGQARSSCDENSEYSEDDDKIKEETS